MKDVRSFFKSIYKIKYYVLLFIVAFLIFFRMAFPDEKVARSIFDSIRAQTGIVLEADNPKFSFIPYFGVRFNSAKLRFSETGNNIMLGKTSVGISPLSLMLFSPALKIDTESFRGNIQIKISGFSMTGKPVDELFLKLYAADVQLRDILKPQYGADVFATADLNVEGFLNLRNIMFSDLSAEGALENISSKEGTNIGFFALPPFSVKKGEFSLALQKSEFTVGRFIMGSSGDDIDGSLRGKWSSRSKQYEFNVKLKFAGPLEKSIGSFTVLLPPAAKKPDGYYNFRVSGDGRAPIPSITPL